MTMKALWLVGWLISAGVPGASAEAVMQTESWRNSDADFAAFHRRIVSMVPRNLALRSQAKIYYQRRFNYGSVQMLRDGSAGVRLGKGRVGLQGHPATIAFYLGQPKVVKEIGVFTFNSDARVNQDYEVRLVNNSQAPGKPPSFPKLPDLTSGPKVIGNNSGGFHSFFRDPAGGPLSEKKVDWVQFRFWQTYNVRAGSPAKEKNKARGWTSLIEIEIMGDEDDVVNPTPAFRAAMRKAAFEIAIHKAYARKSSWDETLRAWREAIATVKDRNLLQLPDLWARIEHDFRDPESRRQMAWEKEDRIWNKEWKPGDFGSLAARYARATSRIPRLGKQAHGLASQVKNTEGLGKSRQLYLRSRQLAELKARVGSLPIRPLRMAIRDLSDTFGSRYSNGNEFLQRLDTLEKASAEVAALADTGRTEALAQLGHLSSEFSSLRQAALLANPLLDFGRLLLVKRTGANGLGLPANWQGNCSLRKTGYDNEIDVLETLRPGGKLATLYRPKDGKFVGDVDLHWDANRMLFSSIGTHDRWQVFEIKADGTGLRQVTPGEDTDVDNYDACYLPDGRIIFNSTASFTGVPCVFGSSHVAMLYRMNPDGSHVRQLCFEQDHDWYPTVLNNGRVLYTRWEYTDTPHSQTRLLMHMNPDGTGQMEYYGSNSLWPNSTFYARPIPDHPTKVVGVISGHHGVRRMGELIVFDPARGRHEANGVVQRIPGYGKAVEPVIRDQLVNTSWPKFLHPFPLSEKYFLASCKPGPKSNWGIYLVDVFDNIQLIREEPGYALFEPIPFRKTKRPPVIPDRIDLSRKDALMQLTDIYAGGGLEGIPRGSVKKLRVFTYHFAYQGMGGLLGVIGLDGPWDIKCNLGTVPVEEDGSALFRVPANTPLSVQPLDHEGKALQLMRSWMTAMPGETQSCIGCHERQNSAPRMEMTRAASKPPSEITPWRGPTRGFSYAREVQPVIDKYCVGCHNGQSRPDGSALPDLRGNLLIKNFRMVTPGNGGGRGGKFSVGYAELARYVRRPGIESDYHLLPPMEFHADTTELVQILRKGHFNVKLDAEAWDRLITWIDLNAPYHGTWGEGIKDPGVQRQRRRELRKRYAGIDEDPEAVPPQPKESVEPIIPPPLPGPTILSVDCPGWPFDAAEAKRRQIAAGSQVYRTIDLGKGIQIQLVLIPSGDFVMGDIHGHPDERPLARVPIGRPFWMGKYEITNEQFARFDTAHDSHVEVKGAYQFGVHGYPLDGPKQPVVRISWDRAMAFCQWLSRETGEKVSLPTEAQWEYACRAGSDQAFSFGGMGTDFSPFANMADAKLKEFASNPYTVSQPLKNPSPYDDWLPKDTRFNDGGLVTVDIGTYKPNAWGLYDMHGNVWEWTRSSYLPFPYKADDGRNQTSAEARKVVRGGSWHDRPKRCRAAFRLSYRAYQPVHDVGFRIVLEP